MNLYPTDIYQKLEFDRILHLLEGFALGSPGAELLADLPLYTDRAEIERLLLETWEMKRTMVERSPFPTRGYQSIAEDVQLIAIPDFVLSLEGLQRIQVIMANMYAIAQFFRTRQNTYPALYEVVRHVTFDEVLYVAFRKIIDEDGNVRPDASPELGTIRRAIISKRKEIDSKFNRIIAQYQSKGYLAETGETIRHGRRVLAVLAEYKRTIRGIIHDESASGKTVYLEPDEIIESNNDLGNFEAAEAREIRRIVRDLCRVLQPYSDLLAAYQQVIVALDVIQAKAQLAMRINGIQPTLVATPTIHLRNAVHPILWLRNHATKQKTVPFTLTLQAPNRLLVLSGPNAGGKSVAMKSVGLLQLMLQAGLLVPVADGTEMGIFTQLFADIGDSQSLDDDLSTYSSRLRMTKYMLERADENTLLLIDEFGSGTDPKMGGSLAEAALREFNKKQVWGVITTHYSNLKLFAYKAKGLLNGCMLFDKDALTPTYEMRVGRPGSSFAFEMATKNGWADDWLEYARKRTGENETAVDELLVDLQREKQEISEKLTSMHEREKKLDTLIKQYENVFKDLETSRKRLKLTAKEQESQQLSQLNKDLEKAVREQQTERNLEKTKELARKVREEREKVQAETDALHQKIYEQDAHKQVRAGGLQAGDYVRMRNGGTVGTVETVQKNEAVVAMGMMRVTVKLRDLEKVDEPLRNNGGKVSRSIIESNIKFSPQLDLRGMSREEALRDLEGFVDEALLTGNDTLRIVHGKGNGILRNAVKQKLREYRAIARIYHPEDNQGGDGVTLVEM